MDEPLTMPSDNSNTTLVKVKYGTDKNTMISQENSNTTLFKVKFRKTCRYRRY